MLFKRRKPDLELTLPEVMFRGFLSLAHCQIQGHWDHDQAQALAGRLRAALDDIPDEPIPSLPNAPPVELLSGPHKASVAGFADILERCAGLAVVSNEPGPRGWDGWVTLRIEV